MEERRAAYLRDQLEAIGVDEISIDERGNLIATLKGSGGGPTVALAAHMDTVFNMDTPIEVRREEERLYAPGVGDDTSGCIGLLWAVRALKEAGIQTKGDFLAVFTVEEELGLFGARKFLEDWKDRLDMFVAVDGALGAMSYGALGINWYKFIFTSEVRTPIAAPGNRIRPRPSPARSPRSIRFRYNHLETKWERYTTSVCWAVARFSMPSPRNPSSRWTFVRLTRRSSRKWNPRFEGQPKNAAEMEGVRLSVERPLILPAAQISGLLIRRLFKLASTFWMRWE